MSEIPTNSISKRNRFIAGAIFFLGWLFVGFACRIVLRIVIPFRMLTVVDSSIGLLIIAGLIVAPLIGFMFGPRWWHKFDMKKQGGRTFSFWLLLVAAGILGGIIGGSLGLWAGGFIGAVMIQGEASPIVGGVIGLALGAILGVVVTVRMVLSRQV